MDQRIVIDPVTRIEGHAKITLLLDDQGEVVREERIAYQSLAEGLRAVEVVKGFASDCRVEVEALGLNRWFVSFTTFRVFT